MKRHDRTSWFFWLSHSSLFIPKMYHLRMIRHFARRLEGRLIDVGCGYQPYRRLLENCSEYVGVDSNADLDPPPDYCAEADRLPLEDNGFDSALCLEVLEHVPDPDAVGREIARVLRRGGHALVSAPFSWGLHYEPWDFRRFTPHGLRLWAEKAGLEVVESYRIGGLFAMVGSRLVDGVANPMRASLERRITPRLALAIVVCYSALPSLFFFALSRLFDRFLPRDAIAFAALVRKP